MLLLLLLLLSAGVAASSPGGLRAIAELEEHLKKPVNDATLTKERAAYTAAFHHVDVVLPAKIATALSAADAAANKQPADLETASKHQQAADALKKERDGPAAAALTAAASTIAKVVRLEQAAQNLVPLLDSQVHAYAGKKDYTKAATANNHLKRARRVLRQLHATKEWTSLRAQFGFRAGGQRMAGNIRQRRCRCGVGCC